MGIFNFIICNSEIYKTFQNIKLCTNSEHLEVRDFLNSGSLADFEFLGILGFVGLR
jgi:hypothetical protein